MAALAALAAGCFGRKVGAADVSFAPEDYGAVGDGITDDSAAFDKLNAAVADANGGVVNLRPGATYRVGAQHRGASVYLEGKPGLFARDVPRFVVRMNGATIKFNDGLKFGSFDPRTGRPIYPDKPFYDATAAADIGHAILAINVDYFEVSGGMIDCNSPKVIVGGPWDATGWQRLHYGLAAQDCLNVVWSDVKVVNSCVDGFLYTHFVRPDAPPFPFLMRNCEASHAGRNCISITGANSARIENCRFIAGGDAPIGRQTKVATPLSSRPKSCFCIEAEASICKNITIQNCQLLGSSQTFTSFAVARGAASDILVENCVLQGAAYTAAARTTFRNCEVKGGFALVVGGQADPRDNTRIEHCRVSDKRWVADQPPGFSIISGQVAGSTAVSPVVVTGTTFEVNFLPPDFRAMHLENVSVNFRALLQAGSDPLPIAGAVIRGLRLIDQLPKSQASRHLVVQEANRAKISDAVIVSPRGNLLWADTVAPYSGPLRTARQAR